METLKRGWVLIDDSNLVSIKFLYHVGKNLWGTSREEAKVFFSKLEADKMSQRFKTKAFEVVFDPKSVAQPFKVLAWANI